MGDKKAWVAKSLCPTEGCAVVVFGETESKAKYAAIPDLCDIGESDGYLDIKVRRFPEMDGREDDPPLLQELVEQHGWWTQCNWCECYIDEEGACVEDEDGENIYIGVRWYGMMASCSGCSRESRNG